LWWLRRCETSRIEGNGGNDELVMVANPEPADAVKSSQPWSGDVGCMEKKRPGQLEAPQLAAGLGPGVVGVVGQWRNAPPISLFADAFQYHSC
jgi:hypothetical protein